MISCIHMSELPVPTLPEVPAQPAYEVPLARTEVPTPHPAQRSKKRIVLIGGSLIVGIGALCGLGYAAWSGYVPNPLTPRPSIDQVIAALEEITTARIDTSLHLFIAPKDADVSPLDFSLFTQAASDDEHASFVASTVLSLIPGDLDLAADITSTFSREDRDTDNEVRLAGTYTGNNVTANIDLTTRSVDGSTYVKPDAIPFPFPLFDFTQLKDTWINISKKNSRKISSIAPQTTSEKNQPDIHAELLTLFTRGIEDGSIIFSVPMRVTHNEERLWKTTLVIDGEKLQSTIAALGEERSTLFPNTTTFALFTDDFLTTNGKERTKDIYRELFARTSLTLFINDDALPVALSFLTRIAPTFTKTELESQQITLDAQLTLLNINEPLTITAPEQSISTYQAGARLIGQSVEEIERSEQLSTIKDLQKALSAYYEIYTTYPERLDDLIGTELPSRTETVLQIPPDLLTQEPYPYTATSTTYALSYLIPEKEGDDMSSYEIIPGTNTATQDFLSEEYAKMADDDSDGLSAFEELLFNTSDTNPDSDSDGFSDKNEVDNGYNPAGEGVLILAEE